MENYHLYLIKLTLTNLKITNVDFLEDREFEYLAIDLGREVDLSALSKMKSASEVKISDDCSYNRTIPWDELKKKGINYGKDKRKCFKKAKVKF